MDNTTTLQSPWLRAAALGSLLLLGACERPPMDTVQHGYRGTGMVQVYNPRTMEGVIEANQAPASQEPASAEGPKAGEVYQNVKVLGDLSVGQFTQLMVSMTAWVAPDKGCAYCHNPANLADDSLYTKVVARRMVQMTQTINSKWQNHVSTTGVTCFTCHRGQAVPANVWFKPEQQTKGADFIGNKMGQNTPAASVKLASLPNDPFSPYLLGSEPIRVQSTQALPGEHWSSIASTEKTYGLMAHMSTSLGVNCTYCHTTQSFGKWEGGPPQRVTAFHGIRMVRDINNAFMVPLTDTFPANRKGELGDVAKANCTTCHQGAYKPLFGAPMLKDHPGLESLRTAFGKPAVPAAAAPADGLPTDTAPAADLSSQLPAKVLFATGQAGLSPEARQVIEDAGKLLSGQAGVKVTVSGFADQRGNLKANMELSKLRAFAVRDALKAAGVSEDRIELKKPEMAVAGADTDARRVEINLAKP
ncbi:MAG: photosynthetic reaction center cytochrome PufC [Hydrogenophaga sp.]|uniref:photosynthetic reaction center cytochrome PufC n=1 Tax=Hydrogenophaga sp. TaxID=1904254 RepID=UPI003D9BB2D3